MQLRLFKQFVYFITNIIFRFAIVTLLNIIAIVAIFGSADKVLSRLDDLDVYQKIIPSIIESNKDQAIVENTELTYSSPEIQTIINEAFPPEDLQSGVESATKGIYAWLEQDTPSVQFSIDVESNQESLANGVATIAINRLESLPECKSLPTTFVLDPFTVECVPEGIDVSSETEIIREQLSASSILFENPIITDSDLLVRDGERLENQYSSIPAYFVALRNMPLYLGIFLLAIIVLQLSLFKSVWKGLQRIGSTVFSTTSSFVIFTYLFAFIVPRYTGSIPLLQSSTTGIDGLVSELSVSLSQAYAVTIITAGIPIIALGGAAYGIGRFKNRDAPYQSIEVNSGVLSSNEPKKVTKKKKVSVKKSNPPVQTSDGPKRKKRKSSSKSKYKKIPQRRNEL